MRPPTKMPIASSRSLPRSVKYRRPIKYGMPQVIVWKRAWEKPSHHGASPFGGGSFVMDEKKGQMHHTNIGRSNQAGRNRFQRRKSRHNDAASRLRQIT